MPAAAAVTRTLLIVRWGHRRGLLLLEEDRRIVDVAHFLMSPAVGAITAYNKENTETINEEFWKQSILISARKKNSKYFSGTGTGTGRNTFTKRRNCLSHGPSSSKFFYIIIFS